MGNTESQPTKESSVINAEDKATNGLVADEEEEILDVDYMDTPKETMVSNEDNVEEDEKSVDHLSDEEHDDDDDDDEEKPSRVYERLVHDRCCSFVLRRFPRTCAVLTGVVLPLCCLLMISVVFGFPLSQFESPGEIDRNDNILANRFRAEWEAFLIINITVALPRACFAVFLYQDNATDLDEALLIALRPLLRDRDLYRPSPNALVGPTSPSVYIEENPGLFDPPNMLINSTELFEFMSECGESIQPTISTLLSSSINNVVQVADPLTFNWIRCYEGATGGVSSFQGGQLTRYQRSHTGQTDWYSKTWDEDHRRLFRERFGDLRADGVRIGNAIANATAYATSNATGGTSCVYNVPAAAWFWFTVQTTVGYGNQAPETTGGRTLVYIVGFAAILAFGGILASAGYILSFLFDNFVEKRGIPVLARPWCASILWGATYYLWMLLIAAVTIGWKEERIGESFSLNNSYWFSYVSTTTVGLGDYFLEPEGVIGADLFIFPFLFLVGFMFLAAFLAKFSEFILDKLRRGRKTFVDTLLDKHVKWSETFDKDFQGSHGQSKSLNSG